MIRPDFLKLLLDQRGAAVILWSCFTISIVLYIVIARNVLANPRFFPNFSFAQTARIVLWLLVVVDLAYYVYWKKNHLKPDSILTGSRNAKLFRALEGYKGNLEKRAAAAVSTYVTRKVAVFAIIEAIAVYGLLLALVGPYVSDQYLLSALSLVLLALEFPRESAVQGVLQRVENSAKR